MMKRFTCILLITTAIAVPFLGQLNFNDVYAADNTEGVTRDEMTQAFIAYCKSRDLTIDGSILDAVDNFTSDAFQKICNTIGIDMTALQAEINKVVDPTSNSLKYFAFTAIGINGFNRIFAQFLLDNDLAVGETDVEKVVKSGEWFTDADGIGCFVFKLSIDKSGDTQSLQNQALSEISQYGTFYKFNTSYIQSTVPNTNNSVGNFAFHLLENLNFSINMTRYKDDDENYLYFPFSSSAILGYRGTVRMDAGYYCVYKVRSGRYYLGFYSPITSTNDRFLLSYLKLIENPNATNTDVTVTSPDIKPDLPEDPTNIAPDGNYTPSDQDPTEPPPDPTGGTPPDWSMDTDVEPDGDGWKIPFTLPDLDIDWKIEGLSKKFPFCIPKDIVMVVNVLNVPAQAPRFTGTVDLFIYEWDVDIDFSDFDTLSVILRNGIFILFCVGLLVITRTIIRG